MHANPLTQPTVEDDTRVDWEDLLDPQSFRDIFPTDSPKRLYKRVAAKTSTIPSNTWIQRLPYILLCTRQLTQLIRLFESFFKALGYDGLRDIVNSVSLNTDIDFSHNMLLDSNEVQYLTALYDFLLREHVIQVAHPILKLLHVFFRHPYQLGMCRDHIVDAIDEKSYAYVIDSDYHMY